MTTAEEEQEAAKLVCNERAKLTATYFNGVAVGLLIVGGIAPVFTFIFAVEAGRPSPTLIVGGGAIRLGTSVGLHFLSRKFLGNLRPLRTSNTFC